MVFNLNRMRSAWRFN